MLKRHSTGRLPRQRSVTWLAVGVATAVLLVACSGDDETGTGGSAVAVSSTVAEESRPVPTVPPSTIAGQTGTTLPGVVNASPTIVPAPPAAVDPAAPASTQVPPSTALVGDPQPNPAATQAPPPPTIVAPPATCDRLEDFEVARIVGEAVGNGAAEAVTESLSDSACRYTAGSVVAEVYFIDVTAVRNDWYKRSGVEPVGEVSGDAVGFASFTTPAGGTSTGYTIALVGGNEGVIVAVRGTGDARYIAGQVAIFANQAA